MARKVCKKCKIFVEKDVCTICNERNLTEIWKGKLIVLNSEKSEVAKQMEINTNGEYAIKT
ncbi:DNA-directed RNA polymerase subunit E'' [archaeon]|nr:DNA-directed RNA polymerase subunit E'' [archaeon]|tara:strand:- start:3157 stop:3339 length:183 start_codon:yes stop_codon:yes gene_type:complete